MKVGSKVICIGLFKKERKDEIVPEKGKIYTIRDCNIQARPGSSEVGCRLEEIVNEKRNYPEGYLECIFNQDKFREIEDTPDLSDIVVNEEGTLIDETIEVYI